MPAAAVVDADCAGRFFDRVGRRVWRRPLDPGERDRLVARAGDAGAALGDFHAGLAQGPRRDAQGPSFLYRIELGEPDRDHPGAWRLTGWELASRLSFLLWNTAPDDALLDAAAAGDLGDDACGSPARSIGC
ncbi:MAG: DUF1592 domain-containing protein [Vicinamibacteria bacterium]